MDTLMTWWFALVRWGEDHPILAGTIFGSLAVQPLIWLPLVIH
jgi:hypothetical protein